jgi:hypothetical protein
MKPRKQTGNLSPGDIANIWHQDGAGDWIGWFPGNDKAGLAEFTKKAYPNGGGIPCPYGKPKDKLWVRETWGFSGNLTVDEARRICEGSGYACYYRASENIDPEFGQTEVELALGVKWRPSIHMFRWASRILLEITDVRVEKLQNISEDDAIAEGVELLPSGLYKSSETTVIRGMSATLLVPTAKEAFKSLWKDIHSSESWDSNPWIWCVSFKVLEVKP